MASSSVDDQRVAVSTLTLGSAVRLDPAVGAAVLDAESMLLDPETGAPYLLDGPATLVLRCLDGVSPLRDIAADIAEHLGADVTQVEDDVLELVRVLGGRGLLAGVARDEVRHAETAPQGLPLGAPSGAVRGRDLDGEVVSEARLGESAVLINWSTTCGYCSLVRDELAALSVEADRVGTVVWLVVTADTPELRAQVADSRLRVLVTPQRPELFGGAGTPVAYHLDAEQRVAAPVAVGAFEVPALVRRTAGLQA